MTPAKIIASITLLSALIGCATAPQPPVALKEDALSASPGKVGVLLAEMPKVETAFPGAGCLLCLVAASVANNDLILEVEKWPDTELRTIDQELIGILKKKNIDAFIINNKLKLSELPDRPVEEGKSRKDYTAIAKANGVDRLIIVNFTSLGVWRNYSAYIPNGAPQAVVKGQAYMLTIPDHKLQWFDTVNITQSVDGAWDEPPKFPGLASAFYQAIERAKDFIKQPFMSKP